MRCNPLKSAKLRLHVRPVHAWGRLCDRSFAAGPSDATGAVLGAQRLVQCKRNGESNLGGSDWDWGDWGAGKPRFVNAQMPKKNIPVMDDLVT